MKLLGFIVSVMLFSCSSGVGATLYYAENYSSEMLSPFYGGIVSGEMTFTNFEPGSPGFSPPGSSITQLPGVTLATPFLYSSFSVDGDDGVVDGSTPGYTTCLRTNTGARPRFVFNFTPDSEGHYPRYFGVVLVLKTYEDILGNITGEVLGAKNPSGADIYSDYFISTPNGYLFSDDTRYSTFIGFYNENGISQVSLKNASCLDHLQFGYSIPEPHLGWIPALGLFLSRRRRGNAKADTGWKPAPRSAASYFC